MNEKQRLQAVFDGKVPDKVPHFELVFQIPEQAFGLSFPTWHEAVNASPAEFDRLYERYFEIQEKIIDTYHWAAVALPLDFCGRKKGQVIADGKKRFGDRAMIYDWNGNGTFWLMDGNDMMDFAVRLYEDPASVHEEARKKCDAAKELAKMQVDQGVDFICINSDFGYNQAPFLSPAMFSEFITPYLHEIVDEIHGLGVKAILHSDGNLTEILDQLVGTGLDGYQSIDPQGYIDIADVKAKYGEKLVLMGNIQTSLMQEVNEELIRESVRYAMKHGKPGGRFILSTSNCIFNGMPLESYHIMLDEYEKLAWY